MCMPRKRALARTVDGLTASRGGAAGLALASVSRRLEECVSLLQIQPKDALTELQERRRRRLAATFGPEHYQLAAEGGTDR